MQMKEKFPNALSRFLFCFLYLFSLLFHFFPAALTSQQVRGHPPQRVSVIVNTGSHLTAFPYGPAKSSTLKVVSCHFPFKLISVYVQLAAKGGSLLKYYPHWLWHMQIEVGFPLT